MSAASTACPQLWTLVNTRCLKKKKNFTLLSTIYYLLPSCVCVCVCVCARARKPPRLSFAQCPVPTWCTTLMHLLFQLLSSGSKACLCAMHLICQLYYTCAVILLGVAELRCVLILIHVYPHTSTFALQRQCCMFEACQTCFLALRVFSCSRENISWETRLKVN